MKPFFPVLASSWLALALSACGGGDGHASPELHPDAEDDETPPSVNEPAPSPGTSLSGQNPSELVGAGGELSIDRPSQAPEPQASRGFELSWRDCGIAGARAVQCAELQVPLNHDEPEGERILIALNRMLVPPGVERRGTLLYNPGGPGGSGKETARVLAALGSFEDAAPGFEVIGFDPRGVGDSSALECEYIDAYLRGDTGEADPAGAMMEVVSAYGLDTVVEDLVWLSEQCRSYWGDLFDHMGSNDVVRDIDLIREALGEEKLNFLGQSYGTRLGALYAQEYPERVRAIVLDAPVGPQSSMVEQVQGQFDELLVVHEAFFAACESGRFTCPPEARALFDAYVAAADALGLFSAMLNVWKLGLSYSFGSEYLPYLLTQQATQPNSDWMYAELAILDNDTSGFIQLLNVNCIDNAAPLLTLPEADLRLDDAIARGPLFASTLTGIVVCNGWRVTPDPVAPLTAPGSPPLLVIGGTHDFRTPPALAEQLAASLENASLVMSEHWGHAVVGGGSPCVDEVVRNYLVDLTLPAEGFRCAAPER